MTPDEATRLAEDLLPAAVAALERLVAIPSVSADGATAVRPAAELAARLLADAGLDAQVIGVDGRPPSVVATSAGAPGAPTVLLYAHLDVQPVGEGWTVPPFEPTRRDGVLLGRGAADDKSGVVVHLAAALALRGRPAPRLLVLLEGEEEIGSQSLPTILPSLGDARPDLVVVTDGINRRRGTPALAGSLRGILMLDVTLDVLEAPVHSGNLGGPVLDAITALARVVATLHDRDGRPAVEGLTGVAPQAVPTDAAEFREQAGVLPEVAIAAEDRLSDLLWGGAAIAVLGIDAPSIAASANVLVPSARARLSVRLPPGIGPEEAERRLRAHLEAHAAGLGRLTVETVGAAEPWRGDGGPLADLAADALTEAWGVPVERIGGGGGIPVVSVLAGRFPEAEIVIPAVADAASSVHGPDENVSLEALRRAIAAEILLLARLAERA